MSAHATTYPFQTAVGGGVAIVSGNAVPATHVKRAFENSLALFQGDQPLDQLRGAYVTDASGGTVNNFALDDQCVSLNITPASALTLNGLTGGRLGRILIVKNLGSNSILLADNSGSAIAGNRIACISTQGQYLGAGGCAVLHYDGTVWRLLQVQPGDGVLFSPSLQSTGGGTPTYSVQSARFQQFGDVCVFYGRITLATKGTLAFGNIQIGLPFVGNASHYGGCSISFFQGLATNWMWLTGYIVPSSSALSLTGTQAAATSVGSLTTTDIGATFDILFSGHFNIA